MSQGIVLFAHNNTEIDYGSVAIANATMIKHHMGVNNITLITDEGTVRHMNDTWDKNIIDNTFENIKIINMSHLFNLPDNLYDNYDISKISKYHISQMLLHF